MKHILLALVILSQGCATIGPGRLGKDCVWRNRPDTKTESVLGWSSVVGIALGFPTFLAGFFGNNNTLAAVGLATVGVSIPLGWWSMGAFEETSLSKQYRECGKR